MTSNPLQEQLDELERRRKHAVDLTNQGLMEEGRAQLAALVEEAEHLPDDPRVAMFVATSLTSQGVPVACLFGFDAAMAVLDAAEARLEGCEGAQEVHLRITTQRVDILVGANQVRQALPHAEVLREALPRLEGQQRCHVGLVLAMLYVSTASWSQAYIHLTDLIHHARANDLPYYVYWAQNQLAEVAFHEGRIPEALAALRDSRAAGPAEAAATTVAEARTLLSAGLISEAIDLLVKAVTGKARLAIHERDHARMVLAEAYQAAGKMSEAIPHARTAERNFRRHGMELRRLQAQLFLLEASPRRRPRTVLARAHQLTEEARVTGSRIHVAAAVLQAAEAAVAAADWDEVARSLTWLKRHLRDLTLPQELRLAVVEVAAADVCGDSRARTRALRRAASRVASIRRQTSSLDLRTASAIHAEPLAQLDLDGALARGPAAVVASIERWRMAMAAQPLLRPPGDEQTQDYLAELRTLHREVGQEPSGRVTELTQRLRDAELRQRDLHEGEPLSPTLPASYSELRRAAIERDTDVVLFFTIGAELGALNLGASRPRAVSVGPASLISDAARAVHDAAGAVAQVVSPRLAQMMRSSLEEAANSLHDMVVKALGLRRERLVVVPTRPLFSLPWSYLPGWLGRPVTVAQSATQWFHSAVCHDGSVAAGVIHGPGLAAAAREVSEVRSAWGAGEVPVLRPAGSHDVVVTEPGLHTVGGLQDALRVCDVVHVSAHGIHNAQNPMFSQIVLEDGPLFAYDLDARARRTTLVVLASCEVGASTLRPLDQPLGLTASLLYSGVPTVVAATTPVHDEESAAMMGALHRFLARGTPCADAVALAAQQVGGSAASYVTFGAPWARRSAGRTSAQR